ncbi:MAG: FAD-dependent oxidoreductase, partial [Myxococcota bacterium]
PTPHIPLRRHLMQLKSEHRNQRPSRVIWTLSPEMYFRSESSGILACAGEEDEMMPSIPTKDPAVFSVLTDKLKKMAPLLLETKVQRYWACVRTFTADRQPLLGIDPRKEGLAWASGFGGRGMTIGLAAGDHVARSVLQSQAVEPTFCPGRITGKPDRLAG